jgi:hypothetical protein
MPDYTLEKIDGSWWLCTNGVACKKYDSLAEAKAHNIGVRVVQN